MYVILLSFCTENLQQISSQLNNGANGVLKSFGLTDYLVGSYEGI